MAELSVKHLSKQFAVGNRWLDVLNDINLEVKTGEFVSLVGHSGCGKSTILRIIAGMEDYERGEVLLDGEHIRGSSLDRGMIFQDHRLLPWLTVYGNIAFALYDIPNSQKRDAIFAHIELVGLKGFENAYPCQLSGGMAQRAAIARALIHKPKVLLMDEPFGALDALTRIQLQQEILKIMGRDTTTMLLVTHDIDEAVYLSDFVIVLSDRPAQIKRTIKIELPRPRDRTSLDFSKFRRRIYTEFFGSGNTSIEYMI
jgi:sulfonate transport system ATP-binding protein